MPHEAAVVAAGRTSRRLGLIAIKAVAGGCARLESDRLEYTVVRAVLHKLRHRRRRWIAFLAAFVLLFNQVALAQHLCLYRPGESPRVSVALDLHGNARGCHTDKVKSSLTDVDATACAAHCDDGDKQTRDGPLLKVPDLFCGSSEVALLRPTQAGPAPVAMAETPRHALPRRTIDYGVLLI